METVTLFIAREWVYDNPEGWERLKGEAIHTERDFLCDGFIVTVPKDYGQFTNFPERTTLSMEMVDNLILSVNSHLGKGETSMAKKGGSGKGAGPKMGSGMKGGMVIPGMPKAGGKDSGKGSCKGGKGK